MQISNQTNQSFSGAFRIKPNEINAKTEIPKLFTQGKQVFRNIIENDDTVIVVRDKYDKRVAQYVKDNNITGIEYFPQINTKSGLDDQKPEGLLQLINDKSSKVITDIKEILTTCIKPPRAPKIKKTMPNSKEQLELISNTLRLNIENPKINSTNQMTKIRDDAKRRTINVIMPDKELSYVFVVPDSKIEDSTRCIINSKGEIVKIFETPDDIIKFAKKFSKLKNENANVLRD